MNPSPLELLKKIDEGELVKLLRELIAIRCEPEAHVYEGELVDFMMKRLSSEGLEARSLSQEPDRPSLLARIRGSGGLPSLIYNGHLSVASTKREEWTLPPYEGVVKEGRIYGAGACDMKGALAAMMYVAILLAREGVELKGDLVLLFGAGGERAGVIGTKYVLESQRLQGLGAVVGEPTSMKLALAERGAIWFEVSTKGMGGLSGVRGINAIEKAAKVIKALEVLRGRIAKRRHPLLGAPSLSPNVITGGIAPYTVPSECKIVIDRRLIVGESVEEGIEEMLGFLKGLMKEDEELKVEAKPIFTIEPFEIGEGEPLARAGLEVLKELGYFAKPSGFLGWTEAVHFVRAGMPAVIWGPGDLRAAHAPDEYISIEELVMAAKAYALLALKLLTDSH